MAWASSFLREISTRVGGKPRTVGRHRPHRGVCLQLECLEGRFAPSVSVLTYHDDNARTGLDSQETILSPADVNVATWTKNTAVKPPRLILLLILRSVSSTPISANLSDNSLYPICFLFSSAFRMPLTLCAHSLSVAINTSMYGVDCHHIRHKAS